jgi:hypothetical protein
MKHYIISVKENILLFLGIIINFIAPVQAIILALLFAIGVDFITGILRARKQKERITSRRMSDTAGKILIYLGGTLLMFILEKAFVGELVSIFTSIPFFATKSLALFFACVEFISIGENIQVAFNVSFIQWFKQILKRAKYIKSEVSDLTKDDTDKKNTPVEQVQ